MKTFVLICTLIASVFMIQIPVQAFPMYIDVISQSVHTEGTLVRHPDPDFSWDKSGVSSVSVSFLPWGELARASADVGDTSAVLQAWNHMIPDATASAEIRFHPIGASYVHISSNVYKGGVSFPIVELTDETTSMPLFQLRDDAYVLHGREVFNEKFASGENSFEGILPVDPSHIYLLSTSTVGLNDAALSDAALSLVVPEPNTMLLLGFGLLGLVGFRRKAKN